MSNNQLTTKQAKGCGIGCLSLIFIFALLIVLLVSCGGKEETFNFKLDEYETTITNVINKNKSNSFIEIQPKQFDSENLYTMHLTDGIQVVITTDGDYVTNVNILASASTLGLYERELNIAFQSLIESVDTTLSPIQQLAIMDKLKMNWTSSMLDNQSSYTLNDYRYTFNGDIEEGMMLFKIVPVK